MHNPLFIEASRDQKFARTLNQNMDYLMQIKTLSMFLPKVCANFDHA